MRSVPNFRHTYIKIVSLIMVIFIMSLLLPAFYVNTYAEGAPSIMKSLDFIKYDMADEVLIEIDKYTGYKVFRLPNPERIVIDIPDGTVDYPGTIKVSGVTVKSIRYSEMYKGMLRVVLDLTALHKCKVMERQGCLAIVVFKGNLRNIDHYETDDRICLLLGGTKLTQGYDDEFKIFYTAETSTDGLTYRISYKKSIADPGSGQIVIDNCLLGSILIKAPSDSDRVEILFHSKVKLAYNIIYRPETKDTAITAVEPFTADAGAGTGTGETGAGTGTDATDAGADAGNKIGPVVIDAGHGGVDPGAVYGGVMEKTLNLDIALRLNKLLKEKGIKTYMIREDDRFVGVYERAFIANNLNASLFLSIHCNAIQYADYRGTMTLYYPVPVNTGKFTGMAFSQILHTGLVKDLLTVDRGLRARPTLAIPRKTAMPASIVEVAYLTNTDDRALLKSGDFRQKAAQSLCNSILESLEKLGFSTITTE